MTKLQQNSIKYKKKKKNIYIYIHMKICHPKGKISIGFLYSIKWRVGGKTICKTNFKMAEERCCLLCTAEAMELGPPKRQNNTSEGDMLILDWSV